MSLTTRHIVKSPLYSMSVDEAVLANYDNCRAVVSKNMGCCIPKERFLTYVMSRASLQLSSTLS